MKQKQEKPHQKVEVNGKRDIKEEEKEIDSEVGETRATPEVASEKEINTATEAPGQAEPSETAEDLHPSLTPEVKPQQSATPESEVQQEQEEHFAPESSTESAHPEEKSSPPDDGQGPVSQRNDVVSTEIVPESVEDEKQVEEINAVPQKAFGPPAHPPPPPNPLQSSSGEDTW